MGRYFENFIFIRNDRYDVGKPHPNSLKPHPNPLQAPSKSSPSREDLWDFQSLGEGLQDFQSLREEILFFKNKNGKVDKILIYNYIICKVIKNGYHFKNY